MASREDVVAYLLKEKYHLTALELYAELLESGEQDATLQDFFSTEAHFEGAARSDFRRRRSRSSSSLSAVEYTECSDADHAVKLREKDEQIALLKHELRLAREDVEAVRHQLTSSLSHMSMAGTDSDALDSEAKLQGVAQGPAMEAETRVLNYLLYGHLKQNGYKMTMLTFTDDVSDDQMLDKWGDVGLDIPEPPPLLMLYRHWCTTSAENQATEKEKLTADMEEMEKELQSTKSHVAALSADVAKWKANSDALRRERDQLSHQLRKSLEAAKAQTTAASSAVATEEQKKQEKPAVAPSDAVPSEEQGTREDKADGPMDDTLANGDTDKNDVVEGVPCPLFDLLDLRRGAQINSGGRGDGGKKDVQGRLLGDIARAAVIPWADVILDALTNILPHLPADKRAEVLPILVATAARCGLPSARRHIVRMVFKFFKQPSQVERQLVVHSCVAIARSLAPEKVVPEILEEAVEALVAHKREERRALCADVCCGLVPFLSKDVPATALLDPLRKLSEDAKAQVRNSTARSLGRLAAREGGETGQYVELFAHLLRADLRSFNDGTCCVRHILVPMLAFRDAREHGVPSEVVDAIFKELDAVKDGEHSLFAALFGCLSNVLPQITASLLSTVPGGAKDAAAGAEGKDQGDSGTDDDVVVAIMGQGTACMEAQRKALDEAVQASEGWSQMAWLQKDMLPRLVAACGRVEGSGGGDEAVFSAALGTVERMCRLLGRHATLAVVRPSFAGALEALPDSSHEAETMLKARANLVPLFVAGVLAQGGEAAAGAVVDWMKDVIVNVSLEEFGWSRAHLVHLQRAVSLLQSHREVLDAVLKVLWDLVVNQNVAVRLSVLELFDSVVSVLDSPTTARRVLPALITLGGDNDRGVRVATIPILGHIIRTNSQAEVLDKVTAQVDMFIDEGKPDTMNAVLRMLVQVIPEATSDYRDLRLSPRVHKLTELNHKNDNGDFRTMTALILCECYRAFKGCPLGQDSIVDHILPGLTLLVEDADRLGQADVEVLQTMISDLKAATGQQTKSFRSIKDAVLKRETSRTGMPTPSGGEERNITPSDDVSPQKRRFGMPKFGRK